MMRTIRLLVVLAACLAARLAWSQFGAAETDPKGPQLDKQLVGRWQVGFVVTAENGPCVGILGTVPLPIDWPEQQVQIVKEDFSPFVRGVDYRMQAGALQQMVVTIPELPAGEEARAVVTLEISRYSLLPPDETSLLVVPNPKKLPKDIRPFLGSSPHIESQHRKIKSLAKEILKQNEQAPAWEKVEAIYDWVRDNVEYQEGPIKGAVEALKDKTGDCEELTSLFIALSRASGVPARMVWVPGHCYPEFYLQDDEGHGHWFPCQAAGSRAFGGIPEHRPILQKGDNFRTPEKPREAQRYVAEYLTGKPVAGGGKPKVKFIRQAVE